MDQSIIIDRIKKMLELKRMNKKQIYEFLLVEGVVKPNSEQLVYEVIEYGIYNNLINPSRIKRWKKKRGKLPTYFTNAQLTAIFDRINRPKLAIIIWMGFFCGLRVTEVCNLKIEDVDIINQKVFVKDSKNTNRFLDGYGKDRIVTIPDIAISPIKKWLQIMKGGVWFTPCMQSPDKHIRPKTVHEQYRELLKKCGLDDIEYSVEYDQKNRKKRKHIRKNVYKYRFHTLRHTYATYLLEKGVPLEHIQKLLGHSQLDTTLVYAKVSDKKTKVFVNDAFSTPMRLVNNNSVISSHPVAQPAPQPVQQEAPVNTLVQNEPPEQILKKRLARGEIDLILYKRLLAELSPENTVNVLHTVKATN